MEVKNERLQQTRKEKITELITKYKTLVDKIFEAVSEPLPDFTDITNKETGEVKVTAEFQKYEYIAVRDKALDNADRILNKINDLERELNNPNFAEDEETEEELENNPNAKRKRYNRK